MIDQLITQIANTMDLSEAEVRAHFDRLINMSQPIRECSEWDELIRKGDKETEPQERSDNE